MPTEHTGGHGGPGPRPGAGWSAVVYGRTYRIDRWWRALPGGATPGGPLGRTVLALVAGGTRLDDAPRFVLYRGEQGVLVGVACQVPLLGPEMAHDEHGRPLYGFVGWHHPDRAAAHDLPGLGELEASFPVWAGDTYRAWAAPVWDVALEADAVTLVSTPAAAPWEGRGRPADPAAARHWPTAHPAEVHLLPAAQAPGLWDAALAAGPMAVCVLTTGWQRSRDAREPGLTHACCADVTEYRRTPRTAPPAPAAAPKPAPKPAPKEAPKEAPKPVQESVRETERRTRGKARKSLWEEATELVTEVTEKWRSVWDAGRSGERPPAPRPRPAPQHRSSRRPADTESYLTGGAAYEPESPAPGLLGRTQEVDAEQASFEGYFDAFRPPAAADAAASGPGGVARPGAASAAESSDAGATGGPAGRNARTGTPSGPGGPGAGGTGSREAGTEDAAAGSRTASAPGGVARPGAASEAGGTDAGGTAGPAGRDAGTAAPVGTDGRSGHGGGTPPAATAEADPDHDSGPGDPRRSHPGGSA
ncbi:hypothetical protein ACIPYQ_09630 [Streptomyces sp. NPDC090045]|uniref:hypothetical protein n=1 Tax=Streptomyces sp. NPDC090045 TaxID=3365927 RepID=UPI00380DC8CB